MRKSLRELRTNSRYESVAAVILIGALWAFGWVPNVVNMLVRGERVPVSFTLAVNKDTAEAVFSVRVIYAVMIATALYVVWAATSRGLMRRGVILLLVTALPALIEIFGSNIANGVLPTQAQVFIYLMVIGTLWIHGPDRRMFTSLAWILGVTVALAAVSGIFRWGLLNEELGVTTDKSLFFPDLLAGAYSYNNAFGLVVAATLPAVAALRNKWVASAIAVLSVITLIWSGSRTSILAVGIGLVAMVLMYITSSERLRMWIGGTILAGLGAACIAVPFLFRNNPKFLSGRGAIWDVSLDLWARSPWLGLGRGAFEADAELSMRVFHAISHSHNFFATVLLMGGVVGVLSVALLMVLIGVAVVRALRWSPVPFLFFAMLLGLGIAETPGNYFPFERPNTTTFVVWVVFAFGFWARDAQKWQSATALPTWGQKISFKPVEAE